MPKLQREPVEGLPPARIALAALCLAASAAYLIWRTSTLNSAAPVLSLLFYTTEALGILWTSVFILTNLVFLRRRRIPAPPGLTVDVFVPSYNEPVAVVRRTLVAALRMRYPHATWLLDDGNREDMRLLAAELGCRYLARPLNTDAKAGNLNNALQRSRADFIALFDADHMPTPDFLDRTLGYFEDPKLAFVQTPQEFYNPYSYAHWRADPEDSQWNEHSLFYRVIQRGRDAFNAVMFCGCAAVMRRTALDDIGGFATGTVTEDMHTSVRLHKAGWNSVLHPQTLSAGLAPRDAWHFCRQRLRWAQGAMQVVQQERLWRRGGMTRSQRLSYLVHAGVHLEGMRILLVFFLPAIALISGIVPMRSTATAYLAVFVPYFALSALVYSDLGRGHGRLFRSEVYNLARSISSTRAVLALGRKRIGFWVTPKTNSVDPRHYRFTLPWVVIAVDLVALMVGGWRYAHGLGGSAGPLAILALWIVFGMLVAAGLIRHSRRSAEALGSEPLLPLHLAGTLRCGEQRLPVHVAGVDACRLHLRDSASLQAPGTIDIAVDGRAFTLHVAPLGGGDWRLSWPDRAEQDEWEYAIHQSRIRALARHDREADEGVLESLRRPALRPPQTLASRGET